MCVLFPFDNNYWVYVCVINDFFCGGDGGAGNNLELILPMVTYLVDAYNMLDIMNDQVLFYL